MKPGTAPSPVEGRQAIACAGDDARTGSVYVRVRPPGADRSEFATLTIFLDLPPLALTKQ